MVVPVPTGGWDQISPLSQMDPQYAPILLNWVPRPGFVELRGGYNVWAQGFTNTPVETLMVYRPPGGTDKMFAASNGTIYDVSTNGSPFSSSTGYVNNRWQYINFTPSLGNNYILIANGVDNAKTYNGTSWASASITGLPNGITSIFNLLAFKQRIWLLTNNSTSAYYLPTSAISGAVTEFPLGPLMTRGGSLLAMGDWTIDGGQGPDDYLVFATTKGQYIVYKGTDPSNANAFALVGVFDLPIPIGARCFARVGSELAVITLQGLIPISQALPYDPSGTRSVAFTNRIQNAMLEAAQSAYTNFGWKLTSFPLEGLLILNIPLITNSNQIQFVMNNYTGAWCQFTGWNANDFCTFNESLYFGDNSGNVNLAYAGPLDLVSPILADMQCAFNTFGDPGRVKNVTMCRPLIIADGNIIPTMSVDEDFSDDAPSAPLTILNPVGGEWDVSLWDSGIWSAGSNINASWLSTTAIGTYLAVRMQVNFGGVSSATSAGAGSVFDTGTFDNAVFDGNGATTASGQSVPLLQVNALEVLLQGGGPI